MKLKPYQRTGTHFLKSKGHALLADEMGLGKTIQAIAALNDIKKKCDTLALIICPASLKLNWLDEMNRWFTREEKIYVVQKRSCIIPKNCGVIIVNYDVISHSNIFYQLRERTYDAIICDEAHYLKNPKAQRTKDMFKAKGIIRQGRYKWMLTGTPILNRPIEIFPMLKVLAHDLIKPYDTWVRYGYKFCDGHQDGFGFNVRGASNLDELNKRIKPFFLRRLKSDVLPELPEKIFQTIPLQVTAQIKKWLKEQSKKDQKTIDRYKENADLGEMAEIRQGIALAKLEQCYDHIDEALRCHEKIVIFAHHRKVINELSHHYARYNPAVVHGGHSGSKRYYEVHRFTSGQNCRIFIGNIQAAGVGINLQVASHVIFVEYSWVPGEIHQAVDRCHRIGQKKCVTAQFLVVKESIEGQMMGSVINKLRNIKRVLE